MAVMAPLAIAGMALAAAGTAANYVQQKRQQKLAKNQLQDARKETDRMSQQANQRWQEEAGKLTRDAQDQGLEDTAAARMAEYDRATADAASSTDVMGEREGRPQVVKTEAAKQLGDQLAQAKAQMAAQSKLKGWGDWNFQRGIGLNRSAEDVGRLSNFMSGLTAASQYDSAATAAYKPAFSLGDALQLGGSMMSMAGGGMGGMAAGATGMAGNALSATGQATLAGGGGMKGAALPDWQPGWEFWGSRPLGVDPAKYVDVGPLMPGQKWK